MGFEARVYIQGAGQIRRSNDQQSLEAYFPTNKAAEEFGLIQPGQVCEHSAFIQFSALNLDPNNEDVWLTAMLDREAVEVEVSGAKVTPLTIGASGHVEGIANLHDVLAGIIDNPCELRADLTARAEELLHATVRIRHGRAEGYSLREWRVGDKPDKSPRQVRMSGVVMVELEEVDELALRISTFDNLPNQTTRRLRLLPKPDSHDLDVWIRHYCNFGRPNLNPSVTLEKGHEDGDFILNYALLEGVRNLSAEQKARLPIPVIETDGQIGGEHTDCQCSGC